MGLGSIAKTFSVSKLTELAKTGGLLLVGYAVGNLAGKAVANAVNKNEQNPQGLKKYINALAQGTIAAVCVSMGGKRTWLKNVGMGAALSAVQTTVETISGKSVLDMLSFNKTATNGVDGLGDGSTDLILPPLEGTDDDPIEGADDDPIEGADDDPIEGADDDPIEGADDDPIEGADDDPIEGADDDPIEGADDEDEGISGNDEEDFDGVDDDDFDGIDNDYDDGISGEDYE